MRLRPFDVLTLGYFATVSVLVLVFHRRVHHWYAYPLGFAAAALVVVVLVAAHHRHPDRRWIAMLRWTYPLIASPVLYGAIAGYVLVLRGHFVDAGMNAWELRAFHGHPNVVIDRLATPPLTELLYLCYFGFYAFFLVPPLLLFLRRRYADLERYTFTLMAALYACYLGFPLVPLRGPVDSLTGEFGGVELTGYLIVPVQKYIMATGDPAGACFPSAHVAGAWAAMFAIRALWGRRTFRVVAPFTVGLTVAVVYTRYHYLSDALAGFVVSVVCFALVRRFAPRLGLGAWDGRRYREQPAPIAETA